MECMRYTMFHVVFIAISEIGERQGLYPHDTKTVNKCF